MLTLRFSASKSECGKSQKSNDATPVLTPVSDVYTPQACFNKGMICRASQLKNRPIRLRSRNQLRIKINSECRQWILCLIQTYRFMDRVWFYKKGYKFCEIGCIVHAFDRSRPLSLEYYRYKRPMLIINSPKSKCQQTAKAIIHFVSLLILHLEFVMKNDMSI